jgi:hypothetical protein
VSGEWHTAPLITHHSLWRTVVLARFFIDRPVLAWVISLVIVLLGGIAAGLLPIAEYPEITPPTIWVTTSYPGAGAQVVADTMADEAEDVPADQPARQDEGEFGGRAEGAGPTGAGRVPAAGQAPAQLRRPLNRAERSL